METLSPFQVIENKDRIIKEILEGKIFIYPTDTIYGIGCSALNERAIEKIRELKQRPTQPFSIIAPNKEWILNNGIIDEKTKRWIEKLPGPYTLILNLKSKSAVSSKTNPESNTLGIRIPHHWFTEIIHKTNVPFITTSVNLTGEKNLTQLKDLPRNFEKEIDYFIDEGLIEGRPSTIVDLTGEEEKVISRV